MTLEELNARLADLDDRQTKGYPMEHIAHEAASRARGMREQLLRELPVGTIIRQTHRGITYPMTLERVSDYSWRAVGSLRDFSHSELRHWPTTIIHLGAPE